MPRKASRARKERSGVPKGNYKSKTSTCAIRAREEKRKRDSIGRPYPRIHCKRQERKQELAKELGLPSDTSFIFRRPRKTVGKLAEAKGQDSDKRAPTSVTDSEEDLPVCNIIKINKGTTVIINPDTFALVAAIRCNPFGTMSTELRSRFSDNISLSYLIARAYNRCSTHSSVRPLEEAKKFWGWMGCCGWRGGCVRGKSLGMLLLIPFQKQT